MQFSDVEGVIEKVCWKSRLSANELAGPSMSSDGATRLSSIDHTLGLDFATYLLD